MEQPSLLDYYKAIENASRQMLFAAQTENWNQVVQMESTCAVLIEQLRGKVRTSKLAKEERREKLRIMQRILRTDAEIRLLADPWLSGIEVLVGDRNSMH